MAPRYVHTAVKPNGRLRPPRGRAVAVDLLADLEHPGVEAVDDLDLPALGDVDVHVRGAGPVGVTPVPTTTTRSAPAGPGLPNVHVARTGTVSAGHREGLAVAIRSNVSSGSPANSTGSPVTAAVHVERERVRPVGPGGRLGVDPLVTDGSPYA